MEDLDKYKCTIEEREEYFRHIEEGTLLFAGVDYPMILREAEKEADVIIWDGGNNDFPFFKPDLNIVLVDSLRPADEMHYFPGETNVRMADTVLVSKVNALDDIQQAVEHAEHLKDVVKPHTPSTYPTRRFVCSRLLTLFFSDRYSSVFFFALCLPASTSILY